MSHENLYELLQDRPFRVLKICTTGGRESEISHPEFAVLSKSQIVMVNAKTEVVSIIGLRQIANVEVAQSA